MLRWFLIVPVIFLAGCSSEKPPASVAAQEKPAAAPPADGAAREVVLDATARQQAGIALEMIQVRSLPQVLRASGRVALNENRTWRVGAVTEGRIVRVLVNPGDSVKQGQILARMHSHMIHESRAEYRKAVAELARAKAYESYAARTRDRARRLYNLKAASLEQTEHAEAEVRNAQTATGNAAIEVERTRRHMIEFLQIPPDIEDHEPGGPAEPDEDLIPIKSPADGTVMIRSVTPGTVVQPSGDLFVVSDLSTLWTIASVPEDYLARLRAGMPVRIYVQAYPDRSFSGRIGKIGEELDPTTRTVKVRVDVPNREGKLKPEMYATSEIEMGGSQAALFLPREASQEVSGQTVVFVRVAEDRFQVRPVQLGRIMEGSQEVVAGLQPGLAVVTRGSFALKSQLLKGSLGQE